MSKEVKRILLVIFLLVLIAVKAQEPYAITLNKLNGLPSNEVYNAFQDSKGFIWLSSNVGLTRYDGFEYKSYHCTSQTSFAGSDIKEDSFGRIWYENFDGYLYYVENDTLRALNQKTSVGFTPFGITSKHLFLIQKEGIEVYDIGSLKRIKIISKVVLGAEHAAFDNNFFYCILDNVIYKIDNDLKVYSSNYFKDKIERTKQIYCADKLIYVVSKYNESGKIYVFDKNLKFIKTINSTEPSFIQGSSFIDDKIWLFSPNNTYIYPMNNSGKGTTEKIYANKSISGLIKDRQNNYWVTTTNEGIFLVPDLNTQVYPFSNFIPDKIIETKNSFYLTTKKKELITCDKEFNIQTIENTGGNNLNNPNFNYDSITNNFLHSSNKNIQLPVWNSKESAFYTSSVKEIIKIDPKYYAIASTGLCGITLSENSARSLKSPWDSCFTLNTKGTSSQAGIMLNYSRGKSVAYNAKDHTIYFAASSGLFKCTPSKTSEIKFRDKNFYASKIIYGANTLIALSTKGNLYKISNDTEFVLLNPFLHINENDVKFIKHFGNKLLVASSQFIYQLDLSNDKVRLSNLNIRAYEISDLLLKNKTLYLISTAGVIKTNLLNQDLKKGTALIYLNELLVNGKRYNTLTKNSFNYNQNDIAIKFSILDFGSVNPNKLYYRINDDNWSLLTEDTRNLQFAKLSPGDYKIEFKLNSELVESKIEFKILPPYWKTGWFISIVVLVLLVVGFSYYRWKLIKLNNKNKLLEDKNTLLQQKMELENNLNKSVLTSIKSQMNPHFFYNALNTIQAYIFTNDKAKANSYLAKFSKLTRLILEQSEKETISLSDEIESLTLYLELEKMRFKEDFEYDITYTTHHKERIEIPPMLIQPYVENAVKHGLLHKEGTKFVQVIFEETEKYLTVLIIDNGIGRKRSAELNKIKSEKYQSFSTQANEKRLEILNKGKVNKVAVEITDKLHADGYSDGTIVKLIIPIF